MVRRMPRIQVYLPDHLYQQVKEWGPASELLQEAMRARGQHAPLARQRPKPDEVPLNG
jgi:hypothetical protein